ncbi:MAG TPA: FAD-dependent monooxygenase [Gammaproteobacteria bacterium]|nr:FAD-dependent monooxygenase [Gammaproteobacteria bacterium]
MPIPAATDVLIVGAGPTGLTLACQLAARGVDFLLIDRLSAGTNESRAAVIHARTLEILEPLGVNDALHAAGLIVPGFTARDGSRVLITLQFDGLRTDYPYLLMIPQSATEAVLAERLRALGKTVHRPAALTSVEHDDHTFIVGTTAPNEAPSFTRCRYVVGCDGMHSAVREFAGIPFEGAAYPESFVLADVHMDWPLPADEAQLFLAPDGLMVVAPLPSSRHRIVATLQPAPDRPGAAIVQAMLDRRGPPDGAARVREVVWSSRFHVHHRMARRYRAGGIFLAGDAAHVHSPAGGQGMNIGIQDAQFLGTRLADVLQEGAPESVLDEYERRRRPVAAKVVKLTDRMTRFATAKTPWERWLRNAIMRTAGNIPVVRRRLAMQLSELATR